METSILARQDCLTLDNGMRLRLLSALEVLQARREAVKNSSNTRRFLANLGFVAGAEVVVLSTIGGNVIVNVKDSRVAVNEDMARHIMV